MPTKRRTARAAALDLAAETLLESISVRSKKSVAGLLKADLMVLESLRADLAAVRNEGKETKVSVAALHNAIAHLDEVIAFKKTALDRMVLAPVATARGAKNGSGKRAK